MAHNDNVLMDATLRALVEQQEEILKCIQSWQTGQGYSVGEYLGRLDAKVDLLLASGLSSRGAATGELRPSAACPVAGIPSDAFAPRHHRDGLVQDGTGVTEPAADCAGGALKRSASLPTAFSGEPGACSRSKLINVPHGSVSFNLPHYVGEATNVVAIDEIMDEDDKRVIEPPTEFASGALQRQTTPQSPSKLINVPHRSVSFNLPHYVGEATSMQAIDEIMDEEAPASFPIPRSMPPRMKTRMSSTKSLGKIIEKNRRDLLAEQPRLVRVTQSAYFEVFGSALIMLNVLSICWQTQITASRVEDAFESGAAYSDSVPAFFVAMQSCFTLLFVAEVGMRWVAAGFTQFVCNGDRIWNMFDILIVSAGLLHQLSQNVQRDAGMGSIFLVRCLRILRLLRVFRTLRYFVLFRELRMLINTCMGGLMSYIWFCCINFLVVLVFGITLTTRTYTYIMTSEQYADDEGARLLHGFFGTLDKSMVTLVQAATGGIDWHILYDLLRVVGAVDCLLLLCFLSFSMYVLGNAAAAVIVESAMTLAKHDTELVIKEQLDRHSKSRRKFIEVFEEMDSDGDGTLTLEEFTSHLGDDRVIAYFDAFQLDVGYVPEVFSLLDVDGSGQVDLEEFIDGCIKLRGEARQMKLYEIQHSISSISLILHEITRLLETSMQSGHQASSTGRMWPGRDIPELPSEGLSQAP